MENRIEIRAYNKVWKFDNRLYAIQNLVLPVPVSWKEIGYFFCVMGVMFILQTLIPVLKLLPAPIRFLIIPYATMQFLLKKKLDGKMPLKYFISWVKYIFSKNEYIERFQAYSPKNEKIKINWFCSQGLSEATEAQLEAYAAREDAEAQLEAYAAQENTGAQLEVHAAQKDAGAELTAYIAQEDAGAQLEAYAAQEDAGVELTAYAAQENAGAELTVYAAQVDTGPELAALLPESFYIKKTHRLFKAQSGPSGELKQKKQSKNYQKEITKLVLAAMLVVFCGLTLFSMIRGG